VTDLSSLSKKRIMYVIAEKPAAVLKFMLIMGLITMAGCGNAALNNTASSQEEGTYINIRAIQANNMLESSGFKRDILILDIRTAEEYSKSHIRGAVNIDYGINNFSDSIALFDRSKNYLLYCRTGRDSKSAFNLMRDLGFKELYNLEGGILEWVNEGFRVEK
jgi:rhodanese-related sulfurtransferase